MPTKADIAYMRRIPTMRSIARDVAEEYGLTLEELRSKDRSHRTLIPRQDAMLYMRRSLGASLYSIGVFFGRDHTTVHNAIKRAKERMV